MILNINEIIVNAKERWQPVMAAYAAEYGLSRQASSMANDDLVQAIACICASIDLVNQVRVEATRDLDNVEWYIVHELEAAAGMYLQKAFKNGMPMATWHPKMVQWYAHH